MDSSINRLDLEAAWREAWRLAPDGANTFYEQLDSLFASDRELTGGGSISSISKNQGSHSLAPGGPSTRTTVDMERIRLACLQLYEGIEINLEYTERNEANELAIYTEGLKRCRISASEVYYNFSFIPNAA